MQGFIIFIIIKLKKISNKLPKMRVQYGMPKNVKMKEIIVVGGYGYANTGDEAQLAATIKVLDSNFPDYQIKILTPNPDYTFKAHGCNCDFAPRTLFFNHMLKGDCYNLDNSISNKMKFICVSIWIYINAIFIKLNLPTIFLNSKRVKMIEEIRTSSLIYFCGGGYLTGKTLSRLWDGILLVKLAKLLNVPVVMSGQTIGVWNGKFNQMLAKLAFKDVDVITVRDVEDSLNDLKKIGVQGDNVFYTHDDALFCEKSEGERFFVNKYVVLNFHYWGVSDKDALLVKINKIVNLIIDKMQLEVVFIPMHPSDEEAFNDYIKIYPNEMVHFFNYEYDFREVRKVISDSELCITMKHHPIVFAMGECVPTLSIAYSDYYIHKNRGALDLFHQGKFCIDLESEDYFEHIIRCLEEIIYSKAVIFDKIETSKIDLISRKNKFIRMTKDLL